METLPVLFWQVPGRWLQAVLKTQVGAGMSSIARDTSQ